MNENVFAYSNRKGNERGIVLYHNKFAETSGWIRTSTSIGVKGPNGDTLLVQKSLGEALDFNSDGRTYYIFRDYASGLEYIRSGRELCDRGLYVDLKAFEYHAFLDFREISDDDFGTWGQLCHILNGRPVQSMNEEVKQVRYKGLINRLDELLQLQIFVEGKATKTVTDELAKKMKAFLVTLAEHAETNVSYEEVIVDFTRAYAAANSLVAVKAGAVPVDEPLLQFAEVITTQIGRLITFAYLCLHATGRMVNAASYPHVSSELISRFGLYRSLQESFSALPAEAWQSYRGMDAALAVQLITVMIEHQLFFSSIGEAIPETDFVSLFEEPHARGFLLINQSDGKEWFNKERFEMLMTWLGIAALVEVEKELADEILMTRAKLLQKKITAIAAMALEAGFEINAFFELLQPAVAEEK